MWSCLWLLRRLVPVLLLRQDTLDTLETCAHTDKHTHTHTFSTLLTLALECRQIPDLSMAHVSGGGGGGGG